MERLKVEAEHNARMNRLTVELQRVQEELDIRTRVVGAEMVRWRAQAEAAAAAVRDAKDEVCWHGYLRRLAAIFLHALRGNTAHGPKARAGCDEGAYGRAGGEAVCWCVSRRVSRLARALMMHEFCRRSGDGLGAARRHRLAPRALSAATPAGDLVHSGQQRRRKRRRV